MADNNADDLDQLLDSALDDFSTLDLSSRNGSGGGGGGGGAGPSSSAAAKGLGLGLGSGLPELGAGKRKGKQREVAAPTPNESHASAALKELRRQTRETVRGLESATAAAAVPPRGGLGFENEGMEDLLKQFEELAGSQDMESIVETMMQQLLSKEILHEPMKEIGEKYPKWMEEHKAELKPEDYDRYSRQYQLILQLNDVYENEPDNFQKIMDLMQKMQECGQPPSDIVQDLAPDLDLASLGGQLRGKGCGRGRGCDSGGGRGSFGGRQGGLDRGPRHCRHCGRTNHVYEKCLKKFGRAVWVQMADTESTTVTPASTIFGSSAAPIVKISQADYERLRHHEFSQNDHSATHASSSGPSD